MNDSSLLPTEDWLPPTDSLPADWPEPSPLESNDLIKNSRGKPQSSLANGVTVLRTHPSWTGVLAFNEFAQRVEAVEATPWGTTGTWNDHEDRVTTDWLQRNCELQLPTHVVAEAVQIVAMEKKFDPVRDYLDDLVWDGTKRIDTWLTTYLGVEPAPYSSAVGSRWLISAVARVYEPGCKADCVLILEGPQGLGKSRALGILGGSWFTDEIADLGGKDSALQICGAWILELAELDSMSKSEVAKVKAFLSRSTDRFRPPYGRRVIEQPRRGVFAGTTNSMEYLRDRTGNRRFWPVQCTEARLQELQRDRDQLWAEAVACWKAGRPWWLEEAGLIREALDQQSERTVTDPWREPVEKFVAGLEDVATSEILAGPIAKEMHQWTRADEMRVGEILRDLGWERFKKRQEGGNGTQRRYRRPKVDVPT